MAYNIIWRENPSIMKPKFAAVLLLLPLAFINCGCSSHKGASPSTSKASGPVVRPAVTVNRVQRLNDGTVEVELSIPNLTKTTPPLAVEYASMKGQTGPSTRTAGVGATIVTAAVKAPRTATQVSLVVQLRLMRQAHFNFTNLSPAALPATKKASGITAVIRHIVVNQLPDPRRYDLSGQAQNSQPGKPIYGIEVETVPAFLCVHKYSYAMWKNGDRESFSQSFDDHEDLQAKLSDDRGHHYKPRYATFDTNASDCQTPVFSSDISKRTLFERAVGIASHKLEGQMINRRAQRSALGYVNRDIYIYGFPIINPPPKKCDFEFTAYGPGPTIWITLKSQPITPVAKP